MPGPTTSRKRKFDSNTSRKGRPPPSKKFRRNAYDSESDDEDDAQVTARDAPRSDPKPIKSAPEQNKAPKATLKVTKAPVKPSRPTKHAPEPKEAQASKAEGSKSDEDTSSESNTDRDGETDDFDIDATADSELSDSSAGSIDSQTPSTTRTKTKRHDPTAFATSISAILGSSLTRDKRADPVLSRSKDAAETSKALSESKLETRAKRQLVAERRLAKEKGRVRDVLLGDRKATLGDDDTADHGDRASGMTAAEILEQEKRLRKTAQRGVVHLFNAVRAAQVRGEEEARKVKAQGVIGMGNREEKVKEMSRSAFLDLVGAGGEKR